jgi:hypothetical protein
MKINTKALELIEKGLSSKTVSKLDESQINTLHAKLIGEQVTEVPSKKTYKVGPKGGSLPPNPKGYSVRQDPNSKEVVATAAESEVKEDVEVTTDPNKEVETQDPKQVGPSSDDGFGDETDGMGMFEGKEKNKPNPWAICHSQVGPKKSRKWERCVKEVKKQLGEGKNPVSLFIENQIMKIVEKNLPPRITKGDLVKYLSEAPATAPAKPKTSPSTKPGTRPSTKPQRPAHPMKNPNPGEKPAPKAKKISPEVAKDEVIDTIMKLLQNGEN